LIRETRSYVKIFIPTLSDLKKSVGHKTELYKFQLCKKTYTLLLILRSPAANKWQNIKQTTKYPAIKWSYVKNFTFRYLIQYPLCSLTEIKKLGLCGYIGKTHFL